MIAGLDSLPEDDPARIELGEIVAMFHLRSGRDAEAFEMSRELLQKTTVPDKLRSLNSFAAIAEFSEGPALLPILANQNTDYADVWSGLGLAHWDHGDRDTAAEWFAKLENTYSERLVTPVSWLRGHHDLGVYHDERGDAEQASLLLHVFLDHWGDGEMDRDKVADARARLGN